MRIDHVTIGGGDLDELVSWLTRIGLSSVYGGAHSNGVTHMAVASFEDGSYVELISTVGRGAASPWWDAAIRTDAGPCAWAAAVDHIGDEARRISALGVPVRGPSSMFRLRPDGARAEWDLAVVGDGEPGATLPFLIEDLTPRNVRVPPPADDCGVAGVAAVVCGVEDLETSIALFRRVYGWANPESTGWDEAWQARCARFVESPVVLAAPDGPTSPLAARIGQVGPAPCAFLLRADNHRTWSEKPVESWLDLDVVWLDGYREGPPILGFARNQIGVSGHA